MEWKKIFTNDGTDKGLISRYTNSSHNSTTTTTKKNTNKPIFKYGQKI